MIARLFGIFAAGQMSDIKQRLKTSMLAYMAMALTGLIAVIFLLAAAYIAAAFKWGAVAAALGFGFGFLLLTLIIFIVFKVITNAQKRQQEQRRAADATILAGASAAAVLPTLLTKKSGTKTALLTLAALAGFAFFRHFDKEGE